jgi:CheY-like chemotaxis protein
MPIGKAQDKKSISAAEANSTIEIPSAATIHPIKPQVSIAFTSLSQDKPNILFIEDNSLAILAGKNLLEEAGYHVQVVTDAETALKLAKSHPFNLIITDIGLPGMSGSEFAAAYRFWEKTVNKQPIPVAALSAHAEGKIKQECLAAGINIVFTKPLTDATIQGIAHLLAHPNELPQNTQENLTSLGKDLPDTEAELFQLQHYPLFDERQALSIMGENNKKALKAMLAMLNNKLLPQDISDLEKAKGGALYSGTIRMKYACQYLERYQLAGHSKLLEELYQQLMLVLEQTRDAINAWLLNSD